MSKPYKEIVDTNWAGPEPMEQETIRTACLWDIAQSVRKMALRHTELISERDSFERLYRDNRARADTLERQNAALRGVITKLKRKAGAL